MTSSFSFAQTDKTKAKQLPGGCTDGQVAKRDAASATWICAADDNTDSSAQVSTNADDIADLDDRVFDLETDPNPDPPCFDNFNRYVDCGNGTVTDTVTGLIWLQDANCLNGPTDWKTAGDFAAQLDDGQCGLTDGSKPGDWRLPTKAEWDATVARAAALGCTIAGVNNDPSLTNTPGTGCYEEGPQVFSGVQRSSYWSSSAFETGPEGAWSGVLTSGNTCIIHPLVSHTTRLGK
jgi:hypothetical protein